MNSIEFIKAVDLVAKEKCISKDIIFEAMELALASAYKKNFDSKTNVRVDVFIIIVIYFMINNYLSSRSLIHLICYYNQI